MSDPKEHYAAIQQHIATLVNDKEYYSELSEASQKLLGVVAVAVDYLSGESSGRAAEKNIEQLLCSKTSENRGL